VNTEGDATPSTWGSRRKHHFVNCAWVKLITYRQGTEIIKKVTRCNKGDKSTTKMRVGKKPFQVTAIHKSMK